MFEPVRRANTGLRTNDALQAEHIAQNVRIYPRVFRRDRSGHEASGTSISALGPNFIFLGLSIFYLTRRYVHNELGKLVGVSGSLRLVCHFIGLGWGVEVPLKSDPREHPWCN